MPFQIIRNDITKVKADAIVNTANPEVAIGDGVDSAIYKAAGVDKLFAERQKIGRLNPGEVAITPAFDMDAKFIIHASGPWWEGGNSGEAKLLQQCYDKSLQLAADSNCQSIAFPLLATGTYRFPQRLAMEIAVDSFTRFLEEHDIGIFLVVFGDKAVKISGDLGEEVISFIDDDYVGSALSDEYRYEGIPEEFADYYDSDLGSLDSEEPDKDLNYSGEVFRASSVSARRGFSPRELDASFDKEVKPLKSLDDVLKGIYKDSFEKHLQKLINKKGLKNSEVYAAANISKQYFSKLLKGQVKPSKEKVLALAVGLRLKMDETVDLLKLAGYALSPISQTDAVGGAIHHIGNVHKYAREEDRPEKTIVVITTDGMENASCKYSRDKIEKMVKRQQKKYGWEFIFIGANIDAYAEAQKYGIRRDRAVNYVCDDIGTANVYAGVSKAVCSVMMADSLCEVEGCLDNSDWDEEINADYQRRGSGRKARR